MRVLYLVHGHEQFSVGGAENAAFSLFREAQNNPEIETWILAAVHTSKAVLAHGELRSVEGTDREYLIGTSCEWFRFTNAHIPSLKRGLQRLLEHIQPEIIHLQHYVHFGIDVIPLLQSLCPDAKIFVTLHEYLALCMHNGQMVTTGQLKLCEKATPLACSMCFPEHNTSSLFLRHHYIKTILESCDALISPSQFLIDRYRDCGIDHPRFYMLENDLPAYLSEERRPATSRPIPRSSTAFSSSVSLISTRARWCCSRRPTSCKSMGSQISWCTSMAPSSSTSPSSFRRNSSCSTKR